jgi:hypothetical protein
MADVTAGYSMKYENLPAKNNKIIIRKDIKMSKKQELPTAKLKKSYSKSRAEHYKDVIIAVLVTGIIAFIAGVQFNTGQNKAITAAVNAITPTASATELK